MSAALAELERIAATRFDADVGSVSDDDDRPVIGHLGADVPRVLIEASGAVPVRLFGRPPIDAAVPHEAASALGPGVDAGLVPLVDAIAAGRFGAPVVIDHSSDDHVRAYQSIGWLRHRTAVAASDGHRASATLVLSDAEVADVHIVDLLHLDRSPTHAYNERQIAGLMTTLESWTGTPVTSERFVAAAETETCRRQTLGVVLGLRHHDPPRLTGDQALAVIRAGWMIDAAAHLALLERLLAEAEELPVVERCRRAFVVGGAPVDGYADLTRRGYHVVGEDHDEGARAAVHADGLPLDDPVAWLVASHHRAPQCARRIDPARRCVAVERALATLDVDTIVVDRCDASTRWLVPELSRIARAAGCAVDHWDSAAGAA